MPASRSRRSLVLATLLAGLLTGGAIVHTTVASAESNGGVRVMPLGDSITEGTQVPGGYRIGLWQRLAAGGYRTDFVGSQANGPANLGDHDHEGHPGWRIDQIDASIGGWLASTTPRSILLHIGTNDILQNVNVGSAPSRLSTLVDHITAAAPNADVFVATIIPLASAGPEAAVRTFNATIPGLVQSKVNAGKHVHLVDMHAALTAADLIDGIHPTAAGYDKMAAVWYSALRATPGSIGNPGTSTPVPTTPVPTTPAGGAACTASYALDGQWNGGFQATVTVRAGTTGISSWTVTWQYGSGQTVTQAWNAVVTATGTAVTARNAGYNGTLAGNASTQFGFLGSSSGGLSTPSLSCAAT